MIDLLLDIFILILLSIAGVMASPLPEVFLIWASLLCIWFTYQKYQEEMNEKKRLGINLFGTLIYAGLSNSVFGFLLFGRERKRKLSVRLLLGVGSYSAYVIIFQKATSIALLILKCISLALGISIVSMIYYFLDRQKEKEAEEKQRLVQSNMNELRAKRLNEQLLLQKSVDERNARLLERENISRNIHNNVGHSITAAIMTLDAADMLYDVKPQEARRKMNDATERIRGSLESIRRAVRVLDEDAKSLTSQDLKEELHTIIDEFVMDTTLEVSMDDEQMADDVNLPHDYVVFLTGVLQECLTNGQKHGGANVYQVTLQGDSAHVRLEIHNNGKSDKEFRIGGNEYEQGFGLKKIVSYVEKCGGKVSFETEEGFTTKVELPVLVENA